ncbi:MFS transporter [Devosia sp.]|uniref:MFS transporter n=1 Tax=Devosia sp. TaxID=1871048 RepID=UPI003BAC3241
MTDTKGGWRELLAGDHALALAVFTGGVALQAIEFFIGSTILPSVVADIGGLELFAWNATVFVVASIFASIFAALRPFGIGPRGAYVAAATGFALGSLICGIAPNMEIMLVGRTVQGFGAGLTAAMSYTMIRIVFPERLWGHAFALISGVWGIATLIGPAIGGIFAAFDAWRWAFLGIVPLAALLGVLAVRVIPKSSDERAPQGFPLFQILLLVGAVFAVSVASILTESAILPALLVGLAVLAVIALGVIDRHREPRLFPRGTFTISSGLSALYATMVLINVAIACDMFVPLFLQRLHGQSPLVAGYMIALVALGWSASSMVVSGWSASRARLALICGPALQFLSIAGLAIFMGQDNSSGTFAPLVPVGIALVLLGAGIGIAWPHISTRLLQAAPEGERDLTSASISMVQQFAGGFGAAFAGVVVNAAGLASGKGIPATINASNWLYGLFAIVPLVAVPIVWAMVRKEQARTEAQPAE